jgi:hypothetical protein
VVQEGGYDSRVLGANARQFFTGLWEGLHAGERRPKLAASRLLPPRAPPAAPEVAGEQAAEDAAALP